MHHPDSHAAKGRPSDAVLKRMDGKHAQIQKDMSMQTRPTVYDPVSFALPVLTERCQLQSFLAIWVAGRRGYSRDLRLFVFVMDDAPRSVDDGLDFSAMTQLKLD